MGRPQVDQLLREITGPQFDEWRAYLELVEPWGGWADDYRAGVLAAIAANTYRSSTQAPVKPSQFFPSLKSAADGELPTFEALQEKALQIVVAFGGVLPQPPQA